MKFFLGWLTGTATIVGVYYLTLFVHGNLAAWKLQCTALKMIFPGF